MSKPGIVIAIAGLLAITSGAYYAGYKHENLIWSAKWSDRDKSDAIQQSENVKAAADESTRRNTERDNIQKAANEKVKDAQSDANAANDRVNRLLQQIGKLRTMQQAGNPAVIAGKPATGSADDMQAVMLSESLGRNQQLANYADNLRISVESCNEQYRSLIKK